MMEILRLKKKLEKFIPHASKTKDCPETLNYDFICEFKFLVVALTSIKLKPRVLFSQKF